MGTEYRLGWDSKSLLCSRHRAPFSCPGWQGENKSSERASWTGMVPKGLLFLAVVILAFDVSSESHGLVTLGVPSLVHGSQSSLVHAVGSDPDFPEE